MGTSRGKIHGIWVFGKFLLPLLSGGFLPEEFLGLVLCSAEDILPSLVLFMLADSRFDPIGETSKSIDRFKIDHRSLKSFGEPLEELLADHGFVDIVFPHSDYVFEVGHIFVNIASLHFEGENVSSGEVLAHVILECFGKVIDNHGPDPFICFSSSEGNVLSD